MINFFSQRPELLGLGLGNLLGCNRSGLLGNNGSFFGRNLSRLLERSLDSGYDVGYGGLLGIDSGLHGFLDAGLPSFFTGASAPASASCASFSFSSLRSSVPSAIALHMASSTTAIDLVASSFAGIT